MSLFAGVGGAAGAVPDLAVRAGQRDVRRLAVPQADVQRRRDRRVRDVGIDVRDVPVPDALPADDPRPLAAADRPAVPALHRPVVLRRGDLGQPVDARPGPLPAQRRPAARRHRPAADARPERLLALDGAAGRASSSPAPASGSSTRRSPRPRSAWCRRSAAAWPRASTTPSARSGSRPGSRCSARSSRARSPASWRRSSRARRSAGHAAEIAHAVAGGGAASVLSSVPRRPARARRGRDPQRLRQRDERHPAGRRAWSRLPARCWRWYSSAAATSSPTARPSRRPQPPGSGPPTGNRAGLRSIGHRDPAAVRASPDASPATRRRVLELEGDGAPIVMFHGYADSADTWRQTLALLARRGRRAIAVDLPGFGTADPLRAGSDPARSSTSSRRAALAYAAGRPRSRCSRSATRSAGASRCGWPSATATSSRAWSAWRRRGSR